jgi:hypothetical protein
MHFVAWVAELNGWMLSTWHVAHPVHHCQSDSAVVVAVVCGAANIAMRTSETRFLRILGTGELGLDYSAQALALGLAVPVAMLCGVLPKFSVDKLIVEYGYTSILLTLAATGAFMAYLATRQSRILTISMAAVPVSLLLMWAVKIEPVYSILNRNVIDGLSVGWVLTIPLIAYAGMKITKYIVAELRDAGTARAVRGFLSLLSIALGLSILVTATFVADYAGFCKPEPHESSSGRCSTQGGNWNENNFGCVHGIHPST